MSSTLPPADRATLDKDWKAAHDRSKPQADRDAAKAAPSSGLKMLGVNHVSYACSDYKVARDWYTKVLGTKPYFDEPFYVGFSVGGFELGIHPGTPNALKPDTGVLPFWGVADARKFYARLLRLGAKPHSAPVDVGGGIVAASVKDPFGNVFAVIENPHFGK